MIRRVLVAALAGIAGCEPATSALGRVEGRSPASDATTTDAFDSGRLDLGVPDLGPPPDAAADAGPADPCAADGACHPDAICTPERGVPTCACRPGFVGDGQACVPSLLSRQEAYVKALNPGEGDGFGGALAVSGDGSRVAVGARWEDGSGTGVDPGFDDRLPSAGAVYVYGYDGAEWRYEAMVKAPTRGSGVSPSFGIDVALNGDGSVLAVAAARGAAGDAAFIYRRGPGGWAYEASLQATYGRELERGIALSADGDRLAFGDSANGAASRLVRLYRRGDDGWVATATVVSPNPSFGDNFGLALDLSADGGVLAVGDYAEDGSAAGVGGPFDDALEDSGAAYVFERRGEAWSLAAYVKATDPEPGDQFGVDLDLAADGRTLAVGANGEDAGGVDSGAVYTYRRADDGVWTFDERLKAPNFGAGDRFGASVALSGDGAALVVGATGEQSSAGGVGVEPNDAIDFAGAAYVYQRVSGAWFFDAIVKASSPGRDSFGTSVALAEAGAPVVVGAQYEDGAGAGVNPPHDDDAPGSGAAFIFASPW